MATVCAFYLNMAKSDHKEGGITFEAAKAEKFGSGSENSPVYNRPSTATFRQPSLQVRSCKGGLLFWSG